MIHSFRKFFEFAGRQSRNWYLGLLYEIIRCILEALQFAALLVVLDGLVHDNITAQTALLAFGIMLVSVIGTAIFWYLAHGKEGEGSYRMCEDKRIQIGNRMKYMPMGYFNSHSLGNLTSVSTATMSDLESMSFAVIVRTLVGVIHASIFSVAMSYFSWKISLIFLTGVILFMVINTMLLRCSKRLSPIRLNAQTEFMDAVLEYIQGMSVVRAFHMAKQSNTTLEKSIDETQRKNQLIERQRMVNIFLVPYMGLIGTIIISLLAQFGTRWFPSAMMGYYLLSTTKVSEFVLAMQRMHIPEAFIIPFSVMFRFFPTISEEAGSIGNAMRMRGITGKNFFKNPQAVLEYRIVPLMMSVVTIGNDLSAAALTRGLGNGKKRTSICKIGFHWKDFALMIIVTAALLVFLLF